jgi:hypothetical protein
MAREHIRTNNQRGERVMGERLEALWVVTKNFKWLREDEWEGEDVSPYPERTEQ